MNSLLKKSLQMKSLSLRRWKSSAVFKLSETNFDAHKCPMPSLEATLTKEQAINLYKTMVNIRRIETASDQVLLQEIILALQRENDSRILSFIYWSGGCCRRDGGCNYSTRFNYYCL